jgi:hypothetical protein
MEILPDIYFGAIKQQKDDRYENELEDEISLEE